MRTKKNIKKLLIKENHGPEKKGLLYYQIKLNLLSKKFDDGHPEGKEQGTPQIDMHVKMNDNYLRTGPYKPKKK